MNPLTLQLPESLHQQLAQLAENQGVTLDQYIVDTLLRQVASAYFVHPASPAEIAQQEQSFTALHQRLNPASLEEANSILAQRDKIEPEAELSPEVLERVKQRIRDRASSETC